MRSCIVLDVYFSISLISEVILASSLPVLSFNQNSFFTLRTCCTIAYCVSFTTLHQPSNPTDIELSKADTSILKAIKYMENNFLNDPSLTETAAYINFSPAHFSRLFKKVIGVSYSEYLNYIRVEMGRNLLLTTNLSIGEIAQLSGFNNSNYFCNVMKKILGDNPSKIRRLK